MSRQQYNRVMLKSEGLEQSVQALVVFVFFVVYFMPPLSIVLQV